MVARTDVAHTRACFHYPSAKPRCKLASMSATFPDFGAIYLDSNPLLAAEWPTASVALSNLFYGARRWWNIPSLIPEPVLIEAEEHWFRDLQEEEYRLVNAGKQLERKAGSVPCQTKVEYTPLAELRERYRAIRTDTMRHFQVGIVPFGKRSLPEMFGLATRYVLPFKGGGQGAGFQDAVILQSVIEHLDSIEVSKGIFITNDTTLRKTSLREFYPAIESSRLEFMELDAVWERLFRSHFDATVIAPWREELKNAVEAANASAPVWVEFLSSTLTEGMLKGQSSFGLAVSVLKLISIDSIFVKHVDTPIPELDADPDRIVTVSVDLTADCTALLKKEHYDFMGLFSEAASTQPLLPPEIVQGKAYWSGKLRATATIVGRQFSNFVPTAIESDAT